MSGLPRLFLADVFYCFWAAVSTWGASTEPKLCADYLSNVSSISSMY